MPATFQPSRDSLSLVLIGSFQPQTFQPAWFALEGLVGRSDADQAKITVIHREVASFSMGPFHLTVVEDRFQAQVHESQHFDALRDLVVGTFRLLRATPVRMLGINREFHFKAPTGFSWEDLQEKVAPKAPWTGVLPSARPASLTVRSGRSDGRSGLINVRIEPSPAEKGGTYINFNDHFDEANFSKVGAEAVLALLESQFAVSVERAMTISVTLLESAWKPQR